MVTVGEFNLQKQSSSPHLKFPTIKVERDGSRDVDINKLHKARSHQTCGRDIHDDISVIHLVHHVFRESRHSH